MAVFSQIQSTGDIYFWKERAKEVDFILAFPQGILPMEVKFKRDIKIQEISTLLYLMEKKKRKNVGVIITNDQIRLEEIHGYEIYNGARKPRPSLWVGDESAIDYSRNKILRPSLWGRGVFYKIPAMAIL